MKTAIERYRQLAESSTIPQIVYEVAKLERLLAGAKSDMYAELRKYWLQQELRQVGITKPQGGNYEGN